MTDTKRLVAYLFDKNNYDKRIRPVYNESSSTYVEMLLYVSSILDMVRSMKPFLQEQILHSINWLLIENKARRYFLELETSSHIYARVNIQLKWHNNLNCR